MSRNSWLSQQRAVRTSNAGTTWTMIDSMDDMARSGWVILGEEIIKGDVSNYINLANKVLVCFCAYEKNSRYENV